MYECTINFTLDTICPWTYLAKKRLDEALRIVRSTDASNKVTFKIHFKPYQLYAAVSQEGEDKYTWLKKYRYGNSEEKMEMYITLMTAYGASAGINYKFTGTVANSLHALRIIQYFQEEKGPEVADKLVMGLYRRFFEEEKHPSSRETLLDACREAGIEMGEAERVVGDKSVGLMDVKAEIREQVVDGIDFVPLVVFDGRRRDVTVTGAKEVEDYVKALETIVKESN